MKLLRSCPSSHHHHQNTHTQHLPEHLANELLAQLLVQGRVAAQQLPLFAWCATEVALRGAGVSGAHLAYLG